MTLLPSPVKQSRSIGYRFSSVLPKSGRWIAYPEQQLSAECADTAADRTLTPMSVWPILTSLFSLSYQSSKPGVNAKQRKQNRKPPTVAATSHPAADP